MKKIHRIISCLFLLVWVLSCAESGTEIDPNKLSYTPSNFPKAEYDLTSNPVTKEGFELGRSLLFLLSNETRLIYSMLNMND